MTGLHDIAETAAWGQLAARAVRFGHQDPDLYANVVIDTSYGRELVDANMRLFELENLPPLRRLFARARHRVGGGDPAAFIASVENP